jgi:electron transfer flavoprotein beta subunit
MNIFVLLKMVPDTVEELAIAGDGKSLETEFLRFKLSDPDEHALEEALQLKEKHGGVVTVVALEAPEVDDALFTALAKGADRVVKLAGDWAGLQSQAAARVFADFVRPAGQVLAPDTLILLRSQAIDDLDGELGVFLAGVLDLPCVGVVTSVALATGGATVVKEFAGGLRGEFTLPLPAVLGIQSAEKPPRYVPFARVRAVMKSGRIDTVDGAPAAAPPVVAVERLYEPEATGRAEMLDGGPDEVADRIVAILAEKSVI